MRTEKELKEMLQWKNKIIVIEQLLTELDEAKDKIYLRNKRIKNLKKDNQDLKRQIPKIIFTGCFSDLNDYDREEIARLIKEGFSSGHLNDEEKNIYWELNFNVWKD